MGWSYGGYLSAVLLTKTDRFQAASLGAGDHNLVGLAGTIDLDGFCEDHLGEYADDPTLYLERSPLFHMQGMTTPCLLQHGLEDQRVPVSQSYELYHTLIRLGQNPILELYPEEGHQFQNPHHILRCMESNLDWFQRHLGRS